MNPVLEASFDLRFAAGTEIQVENFVIPEHTPATVLFGASGAGKSSVLRSLAGLERPHSGRIQYRGQTWFDSHTRACVPTRKRRIGFVPQDYQLFPHLSVEANICYGMRDVSSEESRRRARELLELLEIAELSGRQPGELSGGQKQRVALARAVAPRPGLLLLDEPFAALDAPTRARLRRQLRSWIGSWHIPTVVVTHDRAEALSLGDRVVLMHAGQILQQGPVDEVFSRPANVAAAAVLGAETLVPGEVIETGNGLVRVRVGNAQLTAVDDGAPKQAVYVSIRAEDVLLTRQPDEHSSARNRLNGPVTQIVREGSMMCVHLECGFHLAALLTRQACEELSLSPGAQVTALIKAPHVHLIAKA